MEQLLLLVVIVILLALLMVLLYGFYRIRRRFYSVQEELHHRFAYELEKQLRQSEALAWLFIELGLKKSLPGTRPIMTMTGIGVWVAAPDFLREIALHAIHAHPKVIVECGSGVSTVVLARCMEINQAGHVYSLEHLPEYAEQTRQELERHSLQDWASILTAPLRPYEIKGETYAWYSTEELPSMAFDMLVVDGPPGDIGNLARYPAGPVLFGRLNDTAAVFLDDSNREQEKVTLQRWAEEFRQFRQEARNCERGCAVLWKDTQRIS